ncbi:hypothetical protein FRB95_006947 [Tulasnella sp. JGI-2019a]|nr:hypothetical protein FRB95_006947 [Tulasnella sp. JGI-2019a]
MFSTIVIVALSLVPTALAHGHLSSVVVDNTTYPGPEVNQPLSGGSAIRMINSVDPIKDVTSDDMSCGNGAANVTATQTAPVNPGSTISTNWVSGEDTNWPHNVGPLMTYIAACNGDCSSFSSLNAEWLKIDEAGLDNATGKWIQEETLYVGKPHTFTFPTNVPAGNYLMRSEIIALHNAESSGGAEFYPACTQIKVAGPTSASIALPASDEVKFPGGYSASDPGILINVYNPGLVYTFPGPQLAFSSSGSGGQGGSGGTGGQGSDGGANGANGSDGSNGSNGSDSGSDAMSTTTATATATAADATTTDCTDGSDNSTTDGASATATDAGVATVTAYVTVTAGGAQAALPTITITSTITGRVAGSTSTAAYRPRRRSRIMGWRHIM